MTTGSGPIRFDNGPFRIILTSLAGPDKSPVQSLRFPGLFKAGLVDRAGHPLPLLIRSVLFCFRHVPFSEGTIDLADIEREIGEPTGQFRSDVEETGHLRNLSKREEYEQTMEEK